MMKLSPFRFLAPFRLTNPESKVQFIKVRSNAYIYVLCNQLQLCLAYASFFAEPHNFPCLEGKKKKKSLDELLRERNHS